MAEVFRVFQGDYKRWEEDFNYYLMGRGLDGSTKKHAKQCLGLFVFYGGTKVKEVWELHKEEEFQGARNCYEHAREVVRKVLAEDSNQTYETFKFRNVKQKIGEAFDEFCHRCEVAVASCGFSVADRERHIRDQIVFGTQINAIREKALTDNLDLVQIRKRGNAVECSTKFTDLVRIKEEPGDFQANALTRRVPGDQENTIRGGQQKDRRTSSAHSDFAPGTCFSCGEKWPHPQGEICFARDTECDICKVVGHFPRFCRDNPNGRNPFAGNRGGNRSSGRGNTGRTRGSSANAVNWRDSGEGEAEWQRGAEQDNPVQSLSLRGMLEDDLFVFRAQPENCQGGRISVLLDSKVKVEFLPDTGASVNIIDKSTYNILCQSGRYPLFNTKSRIYAYGSDEPLKLKGYFNVEGNFNQRSTILLIFVLDANNCGNLLSKQSCATLGVVEVVRGEECVRSVSTNHNLSGSNVSGVNSWGPRAACSDISGPNVSGSNISGSNSGIEGVSDCSGPIPSNISDLLDKFPEGVGLIKGVELKINIDEEVQPVVQVARRIPLALRKVVEEKVEELERDGRIDRVEGPTKWLSPVHIVTQGSKHRMVVDMTRANKAILRTRRTLPTTEEILCELGGAQYFSKVDMRSAYQQIALHPESRDITTFATHCGTFRCNRLSFGVACASEEFDEIMKQVLSGLNGVKSAADDILIFGKSRKEHDENLYQCLLRLLESGVTISREKCVFGATEVSFFGHWVSGKGSRPMLKDNLAYLERPQGKSEVRSFMGLVNFIGKFIPNFSTVVAPISSLVSKEAVFVWGSEQEEAFKVIKAEISSPRMLHHFDPVKRTSVIVDASPVGLCAILTQEGNPVLFVSRKLSKVETRYCQTEREALAVVWACERLHFYLYGIDFTMWTDHKALEILYSPRGKPAARILRWYVRLMPYRFEIRYRKGADNPADYFSRKPVAECTGEEETSVTESENYVNQVMLGAIPHCFTLQEITAESVRDKQLQRLVRCVNENDWSDAGDLGRYKQVSSELMCKNGIVMRGDQVVLPNSLRSRALKLAHSSHMGMTKMKQYLRLRVWWPGLDGDVDSMVRACGICQAVNPEGAEKLEPLRSPPFPDRPFSRVHIDLFGPLATGETILGIVDAFSNWPELYVLDEGTETKDVIAALDDLFGRFGSADRVVSDNGPQFVSWEFDNYMSSKGIKHHLITSYFPQANATIERFFRNLKKFVKVCSLEAKVVKDELCRFLRMFRNTPCRATGRTPASLVLNYNPKVDIPGIGKDKPLFQEVKEYNEQYKADMKEDADKVNCFRYTKLKVGDKVLVKNMTDKRKHAPVFNPNPLTIISLQGNQVGLRDERSRRTYTRPLMYVKRFTEPLEPVRKTLDKEGFRKNVLS